MNINKIKETDTKWSLKLEDCIQKYNNSEAEKKRLELDYTIDVKNLKKKYEEEEHKLSSKINMLSEEKNNVTDKLSKELNVLKTELEQLKKENQILIEDKEMQIKYLKEENCKYLTELTSLKKNANDSLPNIRTIKEMTNERKIFEEQIVRMRTKNDHLVKEINSLQIRLKSISEIIKIQEDQLESKNNELDISALSRINVKTRESLLYIWRNKVFELLVQLKSQEIHFKIDKDITEKSISEFECLLGEQESKNKILKNIIEDKKAELSVTNTNNAALNMQINELKEVNQSLLQKQSEDLQSSMELKKFVLSLIKQYQCIEDSFKIANKKLTHLDQRVELAKNRIGFIKAIYKRKESHHKEELNRKLNILDMTTNLSSIHCSIEKYESNILIPNEFGEIPVENPNYIKINNNEHETLDAIKKELENVLKERDILTTKFQADVKLINDRMKVMQSESELVSNSLKAQLKESRELYEFKQAEVNKINKELKQKINEFEVVQLKHDDLQMKYNALNNELDNKTKETSKQHEFDLNEKLNIMEEKLIEARRDQAKAVVIMRQMERTNNREKERLEEMLKSYENYYKDHVDKLKTKIISLEKEKNILISSLKQQNIFPKENGKLKIFY